MSRETAAGMATWTQMCRVFQTTRQAICKARHAAEAEPRVRTVIEASDTEELKTAIRSIVAEHKAWGVRKVWATLKRAGKRVSCRRVYRLMKKMGLTLPASPIRGDITRGHVAVPESNRRWATDLTTAWTRLDGWVAIAPVIDCGDRYLLDIDVSKSQDALHALAPLRRALEREFSARCRVPMGLELRSDHGSQYTGQDCAELCKEWGVEHTFAPIGRPTGNAVVERFMLTMKTELIWLHDWESAEELASAVRLWRLIYNRRRPHQSLKWRTPEEQRQLVTGAEQTAA